MKTKIKIFSILLVLFAVLGITSCEKPTATTATTTTTKNTVSVVGTWRKDGKNFYDKLVFNDSGSVKFYIEEELQGTVSYTQSGTKVTLFGELAGITGTVSKTTLTLSYEGDYIEFLRQ